MLTNLLPLCVVAPDLWKLVCEITQSKNERKGRSASVNESSFAEHTLSLIIFVTNSECNSPFHVVLRDVMSLSHVGVQLS